MLHFERTERASVAMEEFLKQCERSGDSAYAALRALLERLEDPSTRSEARIFLGQLQRRFDTTESADRCFSTHHFRIHDFPLQEFDGSRPKRKLTMLEVPSIFIPEDWSFTFFEGISRHPDSIFKDRTFAELGCGNGWISIALAEKWSPAKVYGLDINPRAIKIARINLFLNAMDENGLLIFDDEKKTLLERVEFHESDLLSYCRDHRIELDRIIGCIPQILNPDPRAMSKMISENSSEEFLYSLSNYCALQGFVEDQFGLGLIARAVEEGISVIKPTGIMIFNIGGRPGQGVCKRLFERRGFHISKIWQTKVIQAPDTDISALVEIEKNSPHRFEFFMGLAGDKPLCARTAWAYGKSGGCISHALSVYNCKLRQPTQVKIIFDFLKNGFQEISSSLDLSFVDDSMADEKIPFLAYLANILKESMYFPHEPPAGSIHFRNLIAGFLRKYHHIPLKVDNIVVFPSRTVAIENALRLFSPRLAVVDECLTRYLPKSWLNSLVIEDDANDRTVEDAVTVIEAPRQSDMMIALIKKLKPQVVITGIAQFEAVTSSAFEHLLTVTAEIGSRFFLDMSDHLELSSLPSTNGVLKYLAGNILPSHASIICGLVRNQVYRDLEVAFMISEEETVLNALSKTLELLEGHTALCSQYYYGCLIHELVAFQISDRHPPEERACLNPKPATMIDFASSAVSTFSNAELSVSVAADSSLIHMDLDQSFLPLPSAVKASIFESFARQNMAEMETDVYSGIKHLVRDCYGFSAGSGSEIICGDSALALFNKLVLCCVHEGGTLLFPAGTNGHYVSAATFLQANIGTIPTHHEDGYKLSGKSLASVLSRVNNPWVYISGPTINPTGLLYSNNEMQEILSACAEAGAKVIVDTSFSGLEFKAENWSRWILQDSLPKLKSKHTSFCVALLGGLSFELLTGGLEFGYLVIDQPPVVEAFNTFPGLSKPHGTVKYAIKKLLALKEQKAHNLLEDVTDQKKILRSRSECLIETLQSCGWEVVGCHGGISMVAKPSAYLGKTLKNGDAEIKLDDGNFRSAIRQATGLCINSGLWTGIPGLCRFTFALEEGNFKRALECIIQFRKLVLGS